MTNRRSWRFLPDRLEHDDGFILVRTGIVGIMELEMRLTPCPVDSQTIVIISGGEKFIIDEPFSRVARWYVTASDQVDRIS